jgi:hypothetical protein
MSIEVRKGTFDDGNEFIDEVLMYDEKCRVIFHIEMMDDSTYLMLANDYDKKKIWSIPIVAKSRSKIDIPHVSDHGNIE